MFEKLREKQPGESTEEKDIKAAIKENKFNEDVSLKWKQKSSKKELEKKAKEAVDKAADMKDKEVAGPAGMTSRPSGVKSPPYQTPRVAEE